MSTPSSFASADAASTSRSVEVLRHRGPRFDGILRWIVITLTTVAIIVPLAMIVYQSFLSGPFFLPRKSVSLDAYRFVFDDAEFWAALKNSIFIAAGMLAVAVPLGAVLAFLMVRTDLPGRRWIEPAILTPVFVSPVVLALGYVVAAGPVGFYSVWTARILGETPWNIYSLWSIALIAGLTHVPHVYLYASASLRNLGSDVEEAARISGANPMRVAMDVSLPMVLPSLLFAAVLMFFLGFEIFGLALVLGDPQGILVLTTYLYKLANKMGVPSYHLMAVVAVFVICITFPLVLLQRRLLRSANKYVALKGKAGRMKALPLGAWRWVAISVVLLWLFVTVLVPISGIVLRSFVTNWGEGVPLIDALTLANYQDLFGQENLVRTILNTLGVGVIGGAMAVLCYTAIGFCGHRYSDWGAKLMDYLVLVPRAVPGLLAGLAFLWVFLFVPGLKEFRNSVICIWLAYTVVWLAYGMRLVQSALLQVAPELEEAARSVGATNAQTRRYVTLPLVRYGLLASWLLIFMIFEREYSTGVYLLTSGTEVIGAVLVSLWASGAVDQVAALSVINLLLVGVGLGVALRFGVKLHG
ncbi:TPA: iron ABC transporter permease [Burkholderia cenocepacia]|nr:iron ABC transporter permease [Burkholderia cenocepacia]